jgi:hypothetical protein
MNPSDYIMGVAATRHEAESAMPWAPVVPPREPKLRRRVDGVRQATAIALRRAADRLEPEPVCAEC